MMLQNTPKSDTEKRDIIKYLISKGNINMLTEKIIKEVISESMEQKVTIVFNADEEVVEIRQYHLNKSPETISLSWNDANNLASCLFTNIFKLGDSTEFEKAVNSALNNTLEGLIVH